MRPSQNNLHLIRQSSQSGCNNMKNLPFPRYNTLLSAGKMFHRQGDHTVEFYFVSAVVLFVFLCCCCCCYCCFVLFLIYSGRNCKVVGISQWVLNTTKNIGRQNVSPGLQDSAV